MNPYSYNISLRICHPSIDPDEITKILSLAPTRKWLAGENRTTPKGTLLEGYYKESYWCGPFQEYEKYDSVNFELEECIDEFTNNFQKHSDFFNEIRSTGGSVELFVGLFIDGNSGIVFPSSLLSSLGGLCVDLSLDIYPKEMGE
nr:hypothetical protein [uncultured bacterium]